MKSIVRPVYVYLFSFAAALFLLACNLGGAAQVAATPTLIGAPGPGSGGNQAANPTTMPNQPAAANPPSGDPRQAVLDAFAKLNTAYPYRLTETTTGMTGPDDTMVRVVEFAAADQTHAKWTSKATSGEQYTIGGKHYSLDNGTWTVSTNAPPAGLNMDIQQLIANSLKNVKLVGPDMVNGVATFAYSGDIQFTMAGQTATGSGTMWIGATDGKPYQTDMTLTVGSTKVTSHVVYEYNVSFDIKPPM